MNEGRKWFGGDWVVFLDIQMCVLATLVNKRKKMRTRVVAPFDIAGISNHSGGFFDSN